MRGFFKLSYTIVMLFGAFLALMTAQPSRAQSAPDYVRIEEPQCGPNRASACRAINNQLGPVVVSPSEQGWWSAQWQLLPAQQGQVRIRNRYTGEFVVALLDLAAPGHKWTVALVRPGAVVRSSVWQPSPDGGGQLQTTTAPIEDFPDSMVWRLVPQPDGSIGIVNTSVVGTRNWGRYVGAARTVWLLYRNPSEEESHAFEVATRNSLERIDGQVIFGSPKDSLNRDGSVLPSGDHDGWAIKSLDGKPISVSAAAPMAPAASPAATPASRVVRIQANDGGLAQSLNIEKKGSPEVGPVDPGWLSAQWELRPLPVDSGPGYIAIVNSWTGECLDSGNRVTARFNPPAEIHDPKKFDCAWQIVNGPSGRVALLNSASELFVGLDGNGLKMLTSGDADSQKFIWTLAPLDAVQASPAPAPASAADEPERFVWLRNAAGNAINNQSGPLALSRAEDGWWSAQWAVVYSHPFGVRYARFRNRWKGGYLMVRDGRLIEAEPSGAAESSLLEMSWVVEGDERSGMVLRNARTGLFLDPATLALTSTPPAERWWQRTVQ